MPGRRGARASGVRWLKLLVLIGSVATLLACLGGRGAEAQSRRALKRRAVSLAVRTAEAERHLRDLKVEQKSAAADLYLAQDRLAGAEDKYRVAKARLVQTQRTLKKVKGDHDEMKRRFDRHSEGFGNRLVALYQHGQTSYAETVLEAQSFTEMAERGQRCAVVLNNDELTLQRIRAEKERLAAKEVEYQQRMKEEQAARTEAQQTYQRKRREQAAAKTELAALMADRARWEDTYAELEQASNEIERRLRDFYASPATTAYRYQGTWVGTWLRPVGGGITSSFGYRSDPFTGRARMHSGVDLQASGGEPVHAAAAGTVIHAGWWGAYGKCVLVDHGSGRTTLYGHLLSCEVSPGTIVTRGQVIGLADSTGRSTGNHVHFEVRRDGRPVSPLG